MATSEPKWIALGHPSYVWRFGQDRRLNLVREHVSLDAKRILDVGCGIGTYVRKFRAFSSEVYGVDVDHEKVTEAGASLPNVVVAPAEELPYPDGFFDVVFLHEVIEHVHSDEKAIAEAVRVMSPGGHLVIFAPNRLYLFETHGIYLGKRYIFKLVPLVNYLPDALRKRFCPHVRAYTSGDIRRLFKGLPVDVVAHSYVFPGFDNIYSRNKTLGVVLRRMLYFAETTPLQVFGLSHFVVARKRAN
ncbi:MAG: methyltransferase domain-containing protein [Chloroflexi bacterium]|nr:methyltransferase domain-containing protein [Chloroflexota bacterium]MDA8187347.1 methyltransferase domain-containing protein [Dehalococcoidales bacterium]